MKLRPELSFKLKQLLLIILYWVTMVRFSVFLEFLELGDNINVFEDATLFTFLQQNMIAATLSGLAIGISTGYIELFVFQHLFKNKSFIRLMLAKLLLYLICISVIAIGTAFIYLRSYEGMDTLEAVYSIWDLLNTNGYYHLLMLGLLMSMGINFLLIMQNKVGIGTFFPILFGKYHKPCEENRIFLFIDLKSSTRMAEKLGHVEYSQMIQSCYADLSELVIKYRGIIYQFVGDEAVITWKTKKKENYANSLRLFFSFQDLLEEKSKFYQERFSVVPQFKGAVNAGKIMVAEVGGSIKSEIAYHGDVLNTAARMMELCKFYQKDLIISETVNQHILPDECELEIKLQGEIKLRGKKAKLNVFSVSTLSKQRSLPFNS